jgi:hypothetical protein
MDPLPFGPGVIERWEESYKKSFARFSFRLAQQAPRRGTVAATDPHSTATKKQHNRHHHQLVARHEVDEAMANHRSREGKENLSTGSFSGALSTGPKGKDQGRMVGTKVGKNFLGRGR